MELAPRTDDLLSRYLEPVVALAGDRRTGRLVAATVRGIIGAESLVCAQIAAFSPFAGRVPA
jgi:hypothetical protein